MAGAAFWSYAHDDDALDDGRILDLARRLAAEYALLTGEELQLFVDRTSIEWGDEWRRRIDNALAETTFFIPVITPRYFKRDECRTELLTFVGQAESLGFGQLVLPILYIDVEDLSSEHEDQAVAVVAQTQYEKWTDLRLVSADSDEHRAAVNRLAQKIANVTGELEQVKRKRETSLAEVELEEEPAGLAELTASIHEQLPDWLAAVEADKVTHAQHEATAITYNKKLAKLRRSGVRGGPEFAVLTRYARDDLPLAERHERDARTYLARTVTLDPLVHALFRLVEQHPDSIAVVNELAEGIGEAMEAIDVRERSSYESMQDAARRYGHISSLWRQLGMVYDRAAKATREGNELVRAWSARLDALQQSAGGVASIDADDFT
jgi:TIR domain